MTKNIAESVAGSMTESVTENVTESMAESMAENMTKSMTKNTRSVREVSGLRLYLRAIVFERPLSDRNVNSKASRIYWLLTDTCRTYSSCAACLCLQCLFHVRRILILSKMTEKRDKRICIKFCFQLGKTSSETIEMMQKAFGSECMSKTRIKEWYKRFKDGRTSVDSDSCSGRPSTTKTADNIERVRLAIEQDRRMTVRELGEDLGIPKTIISEILTKNLGMKRVCAKFIPKLLTAEQKNIRLEIALDNLEMVNNDDNMLRKVITGDESWVYGYDLETKQQSSQWKHSESPRPKKARQSRSNVKSMLIVFFRL